MIWDEDKVVDEVETPVAAAGQVEWAAHKPLGQAAIASAQTAKNASNT